MQFHIITSNDIDDIITPFSWLFVQTVSLNENNMVAWR